MYAFGRYSLPSWGSFLLFLVYWEFLSWMGIEFCQMLFLHFLICHLTFIIIFLRLIFCYIHFTDGRIKPQQWSNLLVFPTVSGGTRIKPTIVWPALQYAASLCLLSILTLWLWGSRKINPLIMKLTKLNSLSILSYILIWNRDASHYSRILYLWICLLAKIYL